MRISGFSYWKSWRDRYKLAGIYYPGIYALAITSKNLSNKPFAMIRKIVYFGMTNSSGGLKSRLKQFDNTIIGKRGHGGAERFLFKYKNYKETTKNLYLSINFIKCNPNSNTPRDLTKMGEVAKFEYICLSKYAKRFNYRNLMTKKGRLKDRSNEDGRAIT